MPASSEAPVYGSDDHCVGLAAETAAIHGAPAQHAQMITDTGAESRGRCRLRGERSDCIDPPTVAAVALPPRPVASSAEADVAAPCDRVAPEDVLPPSIPRQSDGMRMHELAAGGAAGADPHAAARGGGAILTTCMPTMTTIPTTTTMAVKIMTIAWSWPSPLRTLAK